MKTIINFSGGRTSAYMLWMEIQKHGGQLPPDTLVLFANTGRERDETLEFIHAVELNWSVPVIWLEYRRANGRNEGGDPLLQHVLFSDGTSIHRLTNDPECVEDVLGGGQLMFAVVLREVQTQLDVEISNNDEVQRRGRPAKRA